jgi:hypothetical protein
MSEMIEIVGPFHTTTRIRPLDNAEVFNVWRTETFRL